MKPFKFTPNLEEMQHMFGPKKAKVDHAGDKPAGDKPAPMPDKPEGEKPADPK
jgi:hypothetical protein